MSSKFVARTLFTFTKKPFYQNLRTRHTFLWSSPKFPILTCSSRIGCQVSKIKRSAAGNFISTGPVSKAMAPIGGEEELKVFVQNYINQNNVMVFSKSTCPFCTQIKKLFTSLNVEFFALELDQIDNGLAVQSTLQTVTGQRTVPNVFINKTHIGGADDTLKMHNENKLLQAISPPADYDYDLVVIGGGSGGLSAAKEAATLGKKVACLDFVKPSPQGSTWGLGGTCVNVGCIPKKLMHQAAILGHQFHDAQKFGWEFNAESVKHNWDTMKNGIQDYIGSLNWNYRVQLRNKNVTYINSYGEFVDTHTLKCINRRGKEQLITSENFIIATGGRPKYPPFPGAEYAITSDDLFSLAYCPGKTLCVGASYVSLECAGFLKGIGLDVTVMVRSILLRGFDQQIAEKIGEYMTKEGIKFIRPCVPSKIEKLEEPTDTKPGKYRVTAKMGNGEEVVEEYDTVMIATGRDPCTKGIGLENIGVNLTKNGFVITDDCEKTSVPNVYAVGDILEGKPELTPVAIQAGRLLARRLYGGSSLKTDYINVPTTVFTPLEYGAIGYSEEDAIAQFGEDDIEVYHTNYWPLEWTVPGKPNDVCYAKLICVKSQQEKVVGFHVAGPNAGEITQGWTVGMKMGATKADFDNSVGIHPTCAEIFTSLEVSKSSGGDIAAAGC